MKGPEGLKYLIRAVSSVHRQGGLPNIFLFATARGGSTWLMEILASQPGMKYYDEPFNIRRPDVQRAGVFKTWESLMPGTGDPNLVIEFLNDLRRGRYAFMNPRPFRPNHRLLTNRIVFKIHEVAHLIGEIERRCEGQIVYLLRHPVPTTLSRKVFPRLDLFLASPHYDQLIGDDGRLREIKRIAASSDHLLRGTVAWCYDNLLALRFADFKALFVTYEELTLNPVPSADLLMKHLSLQDRDAMLRAFTQPSHNITMSSQETQTVIARATERERRLYLVNKWESKISAQARADVTTILTLFGLDVYSGESLLPHRRYLHFPETARLMDEMRAATVE